MNEIHVFKTIRWEYDVWNIIDNTISESIDFNNIKEKLDI